MRVFNIRNVSDALPLAIRALKKDGVQRESRNGPVLVFPEPVTTIYQKPLERVLFYAERDANPFFHFMEAMWMLAGKRDVAFVSYFASNMKNYSDNGINFHAAYGFRWRNHFQVDQLSAIINMLKKNPDDRRAVLSMWDANVDGLGREGKDFACNLQAIFSIDHEGKMNMTVTNRSNDIIWGAYGANAVQFSYLLEYVATCVGVPVGKYYQVSNNFHCYLDTLSKGEIEVGPNPYAEQGCTHAPLMSTDQKSWDMDLELFMQKGPITGFRDPFFTGVVTPIWWSFKAFKDKADPERFKKAKEIIEQCQDKAWMAACWQWLDRREKAKAKAEDDGVGYAA